MVREVRTFQVTVPAGTSQDAPLVTPMTMPARVVASVALRFPPGPGGEVGAALALAGQPVIPYAPDTWIVADNENIEWALTDFLDSGAWSLYTYNTGQYSHTLYVRFALNLPEAAPAQPISILPGGSLSGILP